MWSLFAFGALLGMQHALEADHLAAVAALGARKSTRCGLVLRGAWWGFGHTIALFAICGTVLVLGLSMGSRTEAMLELGVGVMVAGLGFNVLRVLVHRRIHFHVHRHGDNTVHVHAHSHAGGKGGHAIDPHRHTHPEHGLLRALAVGLMHGAAGSAGLLVLVVAAAKSAVAALAYVTCFGVGSILGMAALSFVVSFPLKALERGVAWLDTAAMTAIGVFAILIGGNTIMDSWRSIGF